MFVFLMRWTGYAAAQELGYFREECLEVVVLSGGPGVDTAEWVSNMTNKHKVN